MDDKNFRNPYHIDKIINLFEQESKSPIKPSSILNSFDIENKANDKMYNQKKQLLSNNPESKINKIAFQL